MLLLCSGFLRKGSWARKHLWQTPPCRPRSGDRRTVKHFWQRKSMNRIYDQLCSATGEKPHQKLSIYFTLINRESIILESYCAKKHRNCMLTTFTYALLTLLKCFFLALRKFTAVWQLALLHPAVAKDGQLQLPDQPYWITEMLLKKNQFHVSPNMPGHTEFVSTHKSFRNIWQEGHHVLHTDLTFSVILNVILFHCSAFPLVWTDGLIISETLALRFCQRFWGDTWQQFTYV